MKLNAEQLLVAIKLNIERCGFALNLTDKNDRF